ATRPDVLEAVTMELDPVETRALVDEWERRDLPVRLKVLAAPYRDLARPLVEYVRELRRYEPRSVITVFIPEYVTTRWWQHLLHNQSALRLKGRLLFTPGVVVVNVPYHLGVADQGWLGAPAPEQIGTTMN
ncbi:MAG: DNA-binding protein, partial [Pseudonocardiaceae bacterium]